MSAAMDALINDAKILVCAGSGGVGKTTFAAAVGVRAAELGRKVLVLTVDPARRLATTLGIDHGADEARVPGQNFRGELFAGALDSKRIFDRFVREAAASGEIADRLMSNPLYIQLSTALSGSQEFTALEKLHSARLSGLYDLIILDTPPTQHALDFLTAPQKIENLFQDAVTRWFKFSAEHRHGWLGSLLSQGTRQALKALEALTGAHFIETLIHFFVSIQTLQETLRRHSREVRELLADDKTKFILVTSFDLAKLHEAGFFLEELRGRGHHLGAIVINRAFPDWISHPQEGPAAPDEQVLNDFYQRMLEFYAERTRLYDGFQNSLDENVTVFKVPEFNQDISEITGLQHIYGSLRL